MSRLYMRTKSDIRKGTGKGASEKCSVEIYWGSPGDSKLLGSLDAIWPKHATEPTSLHLTLGEKQNPIDSEIMSYSNWFNNDEDIQSIS